MNIIKTGLVASTALTLSLSTAYAGSANTLYLDQNGSNNVSDVDQSAGSGGNDIGTTGNHALQDGDGNQFKYRNTLSGAGSNNDIVNVLQDGNDNTMYFQDWNGAHNNVTNDAQQNGDNNSLSVKRNGGDDNVLDVARVDGSDNDIKIYQSGQSGTIQNVHIVGDGNGHSSHGNNTRYGVEISQSGGSGNIIRNATITGDNNDGLAGYGYYDPDYDVRGTAIRIEQYGNANDANATMWGSGGNAIYIGQTGGDGNFGDVNQGSSLGSTGNATKLTQTGSYNSGTITQSDSYNTALVTQTGTGNFLTATQVGDGNSLTTSFTGDSNGGMGMDGVAGDLVTSQSELTAGNMFQDSSGEISGNSINYIVNGSSNLFAFAQIGASNTIDGTVGTSTVASIGNQAAVLQEGSNNNATFSQAGNGGNYVSVSQ